MATILCLTQIQEVLAFGNTNANINDGRSVFRYPDDTEAWYLYESEITEQRYPLFKQAGQFANVDIKKLELNPYTVTGIGVAAFKDSYIEEITIPNTISLLGKSAFLASNKLKTVNVPPSVKQISFSCFKDCAALTSVTLGATLPIQLGIIGRSAFQSYTALTSINIPISITDIVDFSFNNCSSLRTVTGLGATVILHPFSFARTVIEEFTVLLLYK